MAFSTWKLLRAIPQWRMWRFCHFLVQTNGIPLVCFYYLILFAIICYYLLLYMLLFAIICYYLLLFAIICYYHTVKSVSSFVSTQIHKKSEDYLLYYVTVTSNNTLYNIALPRKFDKIICQTLRWYTFFKFSTLQFYCVQWP